jgi:hypothetical protein
MLPYVSDAWLDLSRRNDPLHNVAGARSSLQTFRREWMATAAGCLAGRPQHPRHQSLKPSACQLRWRLLHARQRELDDLLQMTAIAAKLPHTLKVRSRLGAAAQVLRYCGPMTAAAGTCHSSSCEPNDRCTFSGGHSTAMGQTRARPTPPHQGHRLLAVGSRCGAVAVGLSIAVAAPFGWRCPKSQTMAPFPHPAHRTGRADLPHPARGQDFTRCGVVVERTVRLMDAAHLEVVRPAA